MKLALFGAGTMGRGIAQVFAAKGHTVLLYASNPASAQRHKDKLAASLSGATSANNVTITIVPNGSDVVIICSPTAAAMVVPG